LTEHENKSPGVDRQMQIYMSRLQGRSGAFPISYAELRQAARQKLTDDAFGYLIGGAADGQAVEDNEAAFDAWNIVPRVLGDVNSCRLGSNLLGLRIKSPILLAPIGVQNILHSEGELASSKAAASLAMPFVLSTVSSFSIEAVAEAMGPMPRWFQLYWGTRRDIVISLIERAEAAGYSAIVVTVDAKVMAWRHADLENAYLPFMHGDGLANFLTDPAFRRTLTRPPEEDPRAAVQQFADVFSNLALTWSDIDWLREQTSLPIIIKGILHSDDARRAVDHGVAAIIVSNHGGRQVDGCIPAITALPAVVDAVDAAIPVLFDSGIRRASHVVKAIALGAKAVLLGRPYALGLASDGEQGVRNVLLNLLAELDLTMRLSGFTSVEDLNPQCLAEAT
jgi:isopentenyl diphosphate isomerase/L-lactate dehydrogenase-like FMN-dependent dehydrogenase